MPSWFFPALFGLALISRELILITVTEKWLDCVPLMQILCAGAFTVPIQYLCANLVITKERSDGSYEQNKIFSISWTNGLSAAVPCLQAAHRLGDKAIRAAALACIDNIVQNSLDPRCGLPNETWDAENGWSCRGWWFDGMYTGGHSGYLVGQTLYYILKGLSARSRPRHRPPDWLAFVQGVVPRLAAARNGDGEYPFTLSEQTGAGLDTIPWQRLVLGR